MADFHLECFQNEYLPEGAREVNAVVTISASGTSTGAGFVDRMPTPTTAK